MGDQSDDSGTPEVRDGPPWVMDEMIAGQAALPEKIAAGQGTNRLGERIQDALAIGDPLLFCGCGTSEHAARAAAAITLASRAGSASVVTVRDAFEAQLDPPPAGVVVAISHDGGTQATREAAARAVSAGATVALITARPERVPDGVEAIATPLRDRSWCHTIAYTSPMLAVSLGLEALTVDRAQQLICAELDARPQRVADAHQLAAASRLLAVGSGVDEISASELALKVEEAVHLPATPLGAEKVLHGHLPAAEPPAAVVILRFDPTHADARDRRAQSVINAVAELDLATVTVRPSTPVDTAAEALIAGAVALQLLTLELAHLHGTNPDLIRREQARYQRAANAGGDG